MILFMKKKIFFQIPVVMLLFLFFINSEILPAQPPAVDSIKSFRLFEDDKLVEISLQFDLPTYFRTKPRDTYLSANLTIHLSKTDSVSRDIKLKTRGVFRNKYCTYPPIELNFKRAKFGYSDLNKISKLKLAVQCNTGKDKEEYVMREYLAYKLFNVMTDTSFRVRLLSINYIDTQRKKKPVHQYGFFIEPVEMLAARTNCSQVKVLTLTQRNIVARIMDRVALFNFMIGNYDWSVPGQHNIAVIKSLDLEPYGQGIAIPHDFDWSGLVNPPYAIPTEEIGIENVRERRFDGICRSKEIYSKELDQFEAKKDEFYRVINEFPYIDQRGKKDIITFLDGFFNEVEGRRDVILYNLMNTCK